MKAVVCTEYGPPDVLQLQEVAKPVPKDNEVLIRVYAAAVTIEDTAMRRNGLGASKKAILGTNLAGEVETVGKDVRQFRKGDQVYGFTGFFGRMGAHAQYTCMSEKRRLARKPANMTYEEAAAVPDGGLTALPFLRDVGKIRSGQGVLIYGASGAVGTAAVQLARIYGAKVTGVCSTANLELVRSLGADSVIDYTKEDFAQTGQTYDIIDLQPRPQNAVICFVNLGVGGDHTYNALKRLPQVIQCHPDKVVVLIGAGDVICTMSATRDRVFRIWKHLPQKHSRKWFEENIRQIASRLKNETTARVALCSLPLAGEDPEAEINRRSREYSMIGGAPQKLYHLELCLL
jgi:D-arabinose 1-dehydrogenase-like Zn-dependent alcohol dehydrogenase